MAIAEHITAYDRVLHNVYSAHEYSDTNGIIMGNFTDRIKASPEHIQILGKGLEGLRRSVLAKGTLFYAFSNSPFDRYELSLEHNGVVYHLGSERLKSQARRRDTELPRAAAYLTFSAQDVERKANIILTDIEGAGYAINVKSGIVTKQDVFPTLDGIKQYQATILDFHIGNLRDAGLEIPYE